MPEKISPQEINRRSNLLHELSTKKLRIFYNSQLGKKALVLFENQKVGDKMYGFSGNYIKTETIYNEKLLNTIQQVELMDITDNNTVKCRLLDF